MARSHVNVSKDHIERISKTNPLNAIEELVWNALDSGTQRVEVTLRMNGMGGVQNVEVVDKGAGIPIDDLETAFGSLGESKKIKQKETADGRMLHGREGRGRFKALSLSNNPRWETIFKSDGKYCKYAISISHLDPDYYESTDLEEISVGETGTRVVLEEVTQGERSLSAEDMPEKLLRKFAFYLSNYPTIQIIYDGKLLRVDNIIDHKEPYDLIIEKKDGQEIKAKLTIIEWKYKLDSKKLILCNEVGFCRHEMSAGVQAPGIEYTAYLSSPEIEKLHMEDQLVFEDMHEDLKALIDLAKEKLREHIRHRLAEEAEDVVAEWKELEIYPYEKDTVNPIERAEREVFNIVAVRVNGQHPTFHKTDTDNKKLTLALIKQALESNPSSLTKILHEIVKLPKEEQDALVELLKRTPLTALIQAGSLVTQRLDTIKAFEHLLFDDDWKRKLLERTQLHRLLVHELWVLGESYALDSDDESLTEVLKKHVNKMGRNDIAPDIPVQTINGIEGIPDLMLSRQFKYSRDQFENLVIELKRPSIPLGKDECTQIEDYAMTVAEDDRFDTTKYRWTFQLLGNRLNKYASKRASTVGLPKDCIYREGNVEVYVKCWSDVLADAKLRYDFFRQKLEFEASKEYGMEYLQKHYSHLLTGRGSSKKKDLKIMAKG